MTRSIGVVGYGKLGQFLVEKILSEPSMELAFVWNRSKDSLTGQVESQYILDDLHNFANRNPDLIIEVAHPCITRDFGSQFLQVSSLTSGYTISSVLFDQTYIHLLHIAACFAISSLTIWLDHRLRWPMQNWK